MLNGYSGIRTRNFGLCLPFLLVGQTMTRQSWTGSLDECPDPLLDLGFQIGLGFRKSMQKKYVIALVCEFQKSSKKVVNGFSMWNFKNVTKKSANSFNKAISKLLQKSLLIAPT